MGRGRGSLGAEKVETASVPTARSECFECGRRAQIQRVTGSFGLGTNGSLKRLVVEVTLAICSRTENHRGALFSFNPH